MGRGAAWLIALFLTALSPLTAALVCGRDDAPLLFFVWVLLLSDLFVSARLFREATCRYSLCASQEKDAVLEGRTDRALKRFLHAIALFFALSALFFSSQWLIGVYSHSEEIPLWQRVAGEALFYEAGIFVLFKNALNFRFFRSAKPASDEARLPYHFSFVVLFSALYWTAFLSVFLLLSRRGFPSAASFPVVFAAFWSGILLYDFFFRRRVTYRNLVYNRGRIAAFLVVIFLFGAFFAIRRERYYVQPYINTVPCVPHRAAHVRYDDETGVFTLRADFDDFKILHLTDVHLGGSLFSYRKDLLALKSCFALIDATRPDLVIVTGDLSLPLGVLSMSFNNSAPVYAFASFMRNIGIPWAFAYGNHDTESFASMNKRDLDGVFRSLSFKTSGTLLYPYRQPAVTGRNNQLIRIENEDGTLRQALFLLDSNAYTGKGLHDYDYIRDDQVAWYRGEVLRLSAEEGGTVPSLAFFHIPLREYRTAYELYLQGSDEVTYYFGVNDEKMIDKVCCSKHPSKLFDEMVALGSTTGTFCGHDHYNNASLLYRGIRLTYGMSIDYLAMPGIEKDTTQRGGEVITLRSDGSWEVRQVPLTSLSGQGARI